MARFLNLNGFLSTYTANDAEAGYVELDEDMAEIVLDAAFEGKVLHEDLETFYDIAEVKAKMRAADHPYLKAKAEAAAKRRKEKPSAEDRLKALRDGRKGDKRKEVQADD